MLTMIFVLYIKGLDQAHLQQLLRCHLVTCHEDEEQEQEKLPLTTETNFVTEKTKQCCKNI